LQNKVGGRNFYSVTVKKQFVSVDNPSGIADRKYENQQVIAFIAFT